MESLVFMIIIGIVSVLFGRSKHKQGQPKNRPFSKAAFEEIRTQVKKQLSYVEDKKTSPISPERKTDVFNNKDQGNLKKKNLQMKQEPKVNRIGMSMAQQKVDNNPVSTNQVDEVPHSLKPDEKTLINGIIWSEIIGEPRSKKPYRPRNS